MTVTAEAAGRTSRRLSKGVPKPPHKRRGIPLAWAFPALIFLLGVHYIAIAAGAWYAFTDWSGASAHAHYIGLANFREIFHNHTARTALENTLKLAFCFVILVNALGLALALGLHRAVKSRNLIRSLFFAPVVMSPLAVSYIWQYLFDYNGALNRTFGFLGLKSWQQDWLGSPRWALWAILLVLVWQFTGLAMIFYLAGLQSIPDEIDEATAVDGARTFYRFRRVTLPLLAPALTISFTFTLILGLRVFDQVIALTGGGPVDASETLATQVYKQTWQFGRFGYGAALALVLSVIVAVFSLVQLAILRWREKKI